MRKFEDEYRDKLEYLQTMLGEGYTTVPVVAQRILHVDPATLRAVPDFPVVYFGSRRRVPLDRLARWLVDKERKEIRT